MGWLKDKAKSEGAAQDACLNGSAMNLQQSANENAGGTLTNYIQHGKESCADSDGLVGRAKDDTITLLGRATTGTMSYAEDCTPCYICNITIPKQFANEHKKGKRHVTLLRLAHEAVDRLNKHVQQPSETKDTSYCTSCNEEVESIEEHEKEMKHQSLKKREVLLTTLLKVYAEKTIYADSTETVIRNMESHTVNDSNTNCVETNNPQARTGKTEAGTLIENKVSPSKAVAYTEKMVVKDLVTDETILAQDFTEIRTENGIMLVVPQYFYHSIVISINLMNQSETSTNIFCCLLCKKRGMTEAEVQEHIKSPIHMDDLQKLVLSKHGIRMFSKFGWSLGHCVVCNFTIYDAAIHTASAAHQHMMEKSLAQIQKNCTIDKNIANRTKPEDCKQSQSLNESNLAFSIRHYFSPVNSF